MQLRRALLREGHVDGVEVARDLGVAGRPRGPRRGSRGPCSGWRRGSARGGATPASAASSAAWRAVEWPVSIARSRSSVVKVASWTRTSAPSAATRTMSHGEVSPEKTSRRPWRCSPMTCSGATPSTVSPRCRRPKSGPNVTPRRIGQLGVEAAGPVLLDQRVAVGLAAVADAQRVDLVAVELDNCVGLEVDDGEAVLQAAEDRALHLGQELARAGRAVDGQRRGCGRAGRRTSTCRAGRASGRRAGG